MHQIQNFPGPDPLQAVEGLQHSARPPSWWVGARYRLPKNLSLLSPLRASSVWHSAYPSFIPRRHLWSHSGRWAGTDNVDDTV